MIKVRKIVDVSSPALTWNLLFLITFVLLLVAVLYRPLAMSIGGAMYLQAGQLITEGKVPYVDFIDLNLPLVMYVSAIVAWMSRILHIHIITLFLLIIWLLSIISVLSTRAILRRAFKGDEQRHADMLALGLAFGLLYVFLSGTVGEREHLLILAFLPYIAIRFHRWEGGSPFPAWTFVAGLAAGLGACLKPHFVLLVIAPELYWIITRRRVTGIFSLEVAAGLSVFSVYALHFIVVPQDMRTELFERWLPLIWDGYRAYDRPFAFLLHAFQALLVGAAASVLLFFFRPRRESSAWRFARVLAIVVYAGVALIFLQHKGFSYHAIPAQVALFGVGALVLAEIFRAFHFLEAQEVEAQGIINLGLAVVLVGCLALCPVLGFNAVWEISSRKGLTDSSLAKVIVEHSRALAKVILEHSGVDDPVLIASTSPVYAYPLLVQLDRRPASRYMWLFPLPMLYFGMNNKQTGFPYRDSSQQTAKEQRILNELMDDISATNPSVVVIEGDRCEGCPTGFSVHEYLTYTGVIARTLSGYERINLDDKWNVYLRQRNN